MKILQVISSFPPAYSYGGALKVAYDISKKLTKQNQSITVYTTDVFNSESRLHYATNPEIMDGITVFRFRNISNFLAHKNISCAPLMFVSLWKKIREFDIIHIHEYRTFQAIFVHHFARKYHIPYIVQPHGAVLPVFEKQGVKKIFDIFWGNKILSDASKIIAVSKAEREQFVKMGIPEKKILIIPNGIDLSEYEILPEQGKFRKKFGIRTNDKIILYLGRLHKRKGIGFLVTGFSTLVESFTEVRLVIAGPDDGFLASLKKQTEEFNINGLVVITGPLNTEEKYEAFVDADILVYPGVLEIFGLVPFEAIMCGTPVIVSDDCGCGEIIKEADGGYLVKSGDTAGLRARMGDVLANPHDALEKVKRGQVYIKENLSYDVVISRFLKLYNSCSVKKNNSR